MRGSWRMRIGKAAQAKAVAKRGWSSAFARDTRGATIIEFALIAAPLMALLIAILQISLTFFAQQTLDTTAEKSVRQLLTGSAQKAGTTQAQFKTIVCNNLPAFLDCANLMVDVQLASSFASANTSTQSITFDGTGKPSNTWQYQPGTGGQITVVKVMYIWSVLNAPLGFNISTLSNGKRLLVSTAVYQTEPFS